ncbi:MAG: DUF3570 domain-containing protein [Polyangiaceae bacterium]
MRRRSRLFALAAGLSLAIASTLPSTASAADTTANDAEVEVLVESVFEAEYPQKQFVEALEKLQLAANVCQEGSCSAKIRAKVLVGVATVLAGGLDQKQDAVEVFKIALKEDSKVQLIKGFDKGPIKAAWDAAKGNASGPAPTTDTDVPRKKYAGNVTPPRGWKSGEAYFYYQEAVKAKEDRSWLVCAGYADDSIAAEERVTTKYIRAQCFERSNRWVQAIADYEIVASEGPRMNMGEAAKDSKERIADLSKRMPKIILTPPPNATNLEVSIDGDAVDPGKIGGELWINPGQRRIKASGKIGEEDLVFERDVSMTEGESQTVDIKLVPQSSIVSDNRILKCLEQSKSKSELASCIGENTRAANFHFGLEVSGYQDSDATSVISPALEFDAESPTAGWNVGASFLVDVVTTASTDIVASASPRFTETRYVPALFGGFKISDFKLGLGAGASIEPDYLSFAAGVNGSIDLADKRVTPSLAYGFGYDIQGRSGTSFDAFSSVIIQNSVDAAVSVVADKSTVVTTGVTAIFQNGDTSKPYRYIPLFDEDVVAQIPAGLVKEEVNRVRSPVRALEQLPTERQRFAVSGRLNHRFDASTLRIDERLYIDTWGLKATTTDAQFLVDVDRVRFWPHVRVHAQTGVDFWALAYPVRTEAGKIVLPNFRTGDRELGPLVSASAGGGFKLTLGEDKNWGFGFTGDFVYTRFLNHLYIIERFGFFGALTAEVSVE